MAENSYCLVLSGGGAKGIYHIGVWKALRELGIEVNAFIGSSIGAILAAVFAQGDNDALDSLSNEISVHSILNLPPEMIVNGKLNLSKASFRTFRDLYKNLVRNKGLDTTPLFNLLKKYVNEKKIRKSGNDLGVVIFGIEDLKVKEVFLEQMDKDELIDYLLASSAFPGFRQKKIRGRKYIDGGVYDNIPYNIAHRRGYKKIIVSDIGGIGTKRKINYEGINITYIKNSITMGGVFDFRKEFLDKYRLLGYLDTMKAFDKLKGYNFFIETKKKDVIKFQKHLLQDKNRKIIIDSAGKITHRKNDNIYDAIKTFLPAQGENNPDWLTSALDSAAVIMNLERIKVWKFKEIAQEIIRKADICLRETEKLDITDTGNIKKIILRIIKNGERRKSLFYYYLLIKKIKSQKQRKLILNILYDHSKELRFTVLLLENRTWMSFLI